ncbi:Bifunctional NAD(P)H-hydrate repair enzyme Nnr [Moorella thermoacetica]|uniref:Bifunctional NAD(P)H-hydrate repair enzyme n=1 Tax=Neomoorella thermoacetica TaxID=1525 RepID=A0AAC9HJY2_NEOTH|nr:NAD(P)H-hydrate dehydratase [Moorella thermoacetica]AOQ25151.1 Bifunctional NAD(P)H-hydrate repair enzyme Nnr [Moorella thermoacetica]TYL15318.1 Bifunctional NAD(P)H-hydrate repair enzyme Nnr [Moorella thermoacetica]
MYLVTAAEMGQLDRLASSEYMIPSIVLMENAGLRVVESIERHFQGQVANRRILIFCGKGNNGGDGLVVARHLLNRGAEVKVFLLARPEDIRGDARTNLEIYQKMGGKLLLLLGESHLQRADIALLYADLVVDAIFGTGFKGAAMGLPAAVINMINKAHRETVAVDLPSGLEADTGRCFGPCIQATWTVTFALPKLGLVVEPGASLTGRLEVADIGIPQKLVATQHFNRRLLTAAWCRSRLPRREASGHKGLYGRVLAVGGSPGLTGAITLAATAALKAGAGLVTAAVPRGVQGILAMKTTEVMTLSLPETPAGALSRDALDPLLERLAEVDVLAIGPGLSRDPATVDLVKELLPRVQVPAVVDADALNALATDTRVLTGDHGPLVLTPHPGEMARLLGTTAAKIQEDRLEIAAKYAREWQAVLLLKGARTVIAWPDGQVYINPTGNPGMATAGSGDVLTGIIAGLAGQRLKPGVAAALGAYLHGAAGDEAARQRGQRAMMAGDLLDFLPYVLRNLEEEVETIVAAGLGRD